MVDDRLFDVATPLGFSVHTTPAYWELIVNTKHPAMDGRLGDVSETLRTPNEIRRSRRDPNVYLFYRGMARRRLVSVVARKLNGDGFLITAYPIETMREGETIWKR